MLALSRKIGEVICIGNDIVVTVVAVNGNRVRLSIEAPGEVRILRGELACWNDDATTAALGSSLRGDVPIRTASV